MLHRLALAIALLCLLAPGCSARLQSVAAPEAMEASVARKSVAHDSLARGGSADRLLIQTASTTVEVLDLEQGVADAKAAVTGLAGRVMSSHLGEHSATLQIRVPAASLTDLLDAVAALGEERGRSTTAEDVTDAYSDLDAEITNLRSLRDRLRRLLDRAKNVEEVLKVERELNRVQTRLDSLEGRRQRMDTDIRQSRVQLQLVEATPPRILGPLGLVYEGTRWVLKKLFVISP